MKKTYTIQEIKEKLVEIEQEDHPFIHEIAQDNRKGVQTALLSWTRRVQKRKEILQQYQDMSVYENQAKKKGYTRIAGVDEVGRGPLAGPVVAAAVILPDDQQILGLNDSKKLSLTQRERLFEQINEKAVSVSVGIIDAETIDRVNIYQASKLAMSEAVNGLSIETDYLLIDAMTLDHTLPQEKIIKGDAKSVSIAAASIIAKVTRDRMMEEYNQLYPGYGFASNAGYGTKEHLEGLATYGVTPIHRRSFSPVKNCLEN